MNKPRPAIEPLSDVLRIVARQYGWERRLLEERAKETILELVPENIRPHIKALNRSGNGVFSLKTDSAAARTNLSYALSDIISGTNSRLGAPVVRAIRLL